MLEQRTELRGVEQSLDKSGVAVLGVELTHQLVIHLRTVEFPQAVEVPRHRRAEAQHLGDMKTPALGVEKF